MGEHEGLGAMAGSRQPPPDTSRAAGTDLRFCYDVDLSLKIDQNAGWVRAASCRDRAWLSGGSRAAARFERAGRYDHRIRAFGRFPSQFGAAERAGSTPV